MRKFKDIKELKQEDLEKINDSLLKFENFIRNTTKTPTDEHIGIYEHWIDCMYDIQKLIINEE